MKIKKGDTVIVLSGNHRNTRGEVMVAIPEKDQIIVKGVNLHKKHVKATKNTPHGGITDKTLPIKTSSVALICPLCAKPTRVGYITEKDTKQRLCKVCKKSFK